MKIAVIAPSKIPARTANSIQTMKMSQAFVQAGHQTLLLAPRTETQASWEELQTHYGLQQRFEIEWLPSPDWERGYGFALRGVRRAKTWGADLVFTRMPQAAALASFLGRRTVFEAHDLPTGRAGPFLFRRFLRGRGAWKLVSITRALADALGESYSFPPELVLIAPDGVDLARYAHLPPPQEARYKVNLPERFTVGYTGHLYPGRGMLMILSMAQELPYVTFLVVGGEPGDVARIQEEADDLSLGNVILTGFVPNQDLPLYQAACDVLLMPYQKQVSGSSGGDIARFLSPMKMFEYLASGRVVLTSDLPVLQEVLKANNSVILRSNDPAEWVKAIEELIA